MDSKIPALDPQLVHFFTHFAIKSLLYLLKYRHLKIGLQFSLGDIVSDFNREDFDAKPTERGAIVLGYTFEQLEELVENGKIYRIHEKRGNKPEEIHYIPSNRNGRDDDGTYQEWAPGGGMD